MCQNSLKPISQLLCYQFGIHWLSKKWKKTKKLTSIDSPREIFSRRKSRKRTKISSCKRDRVHNVEDTNDSEDLDITSGDKNFRPDKVHKKRSKRKENSEEYRPEIEDSEELDNASEETNSTRDKMLLQEGIACQKVDNYTKIFTRFNHNKRDTTTKF